jgi:hypothetical protein
VRVTKLGQEGHHTQKHGRSGNLKPSKDKALKLTYGRPAEGCVGGRSQATVSILSGENVTVNSFTVLRVPL